MMLNCYKQSCVVVNSMLCLFTITYIAVTWVILCYSI